MTIGTSRPCTEANAVEVVAVAIAFEERFGVQTLQNLAEVLAKNFADDFPGEGREEAQTYAVPTDPVVLEQMGALQPVKELHEVSRFLAQKNGRFSKRIRATEDALIFECFEYTNFKNFLSDAEKLFNTLLDNLSVERPIREIGMMAVDRFFYSKDLTEKDYSVSEVFSENTKYLTPACRESGLIWHVNQGFFENWVEDKRILQQVNVSSVRIESSGEYCSKIEHRSLMRGFSSSVNISSLKNEFSLKSIISKFHELNINVLKDLLTDEKKKQINLM